MTEQEINHHKRPRNIAFDILRLVAMLMVTLLHITGHGLRDVQIEPVSGAYWITLILNTFSLVAVNCFVLISGYFLSSRNSSHKKLVLLWLQVWTYSVMVYIVLCLIPEVDVHFRLSTLVECMFPLMSNQYWFFNCYFLLYLIAPALNRLTQAWNQTEYQKVLAVLLVVFSLVPSINIWGDSFGINHGYGLVWFAILYLLAAYMRRFDFRLPVHPAAAYLLPCVFLCAFWAAVALWDTDVGSVYVLLNNQCGYNGPLILCASVGLFLWAGNASLKIGKRSEKIIITMASLSFGIYLLHDHSVIRTVLWNDWLHLKEIVSHGGVFLLRIILALMIIFAAGLALEFARRKAMTVIIRIFPRRNKSVWKE